MWFDDAQSLQEKYALAAELGLRGVGPYRWDQATGENAGRMFEAISEGFLGNRRIAGNGTALTTDEGGQEDAAVM